VINLAAESTAALQHGFGRSTWTINDLWVAVVGIGGDLRRTDVAEITEGDRPASPGEHDLIATALNDYFTDHGENHPVLLWEALAARA
jgi:hypothetical protein